MVGILRSFYFKFMHRALPCNYTLYKMCIVETEYCWHCYNVPGTLMHMFWDCPCVQKLLNIIWKYLSISANKKFEVDIDSVMLCTYDNENKIFTLYFHGCEIIPVFLQICRKGTWPVECWNKILYYKDREELIYLKHNKTTKFKAKWHPFN